MTDQEISEYLFLEDQDQKGDIAIVFGILDWADPLEKAVELYKTKAVPKILFTGGINRSSGGHEARSMYEEALRIGIPEEDLLLEDQATNTLENVLFSRRLLEEKGMLDDIHVVCAVMGNVYSRRTLMTLKQHMPENIICKSCPYIYKRFGFTKENWMESETGHRIVKSELEKIVEYLQKGDIQELP